MQTSTGLRLSDYASGELIWDPRFIGWRWTSYRWEVVALADDRRTCLRLLKERCSSTTPAEVRERGEGPPKRLPTMPVQNPHASFDFFAGCK